MVDAQEIRDPRRLLALLQRAKQINQSTLVSFDPGHAWAIEPTPAVEGLLRLADLLLVNSSELAALAGDAGDARQNVIHEAGLFQGRHGFERVMLLVEEDCEVFPELAGLPAVRLPRGRVETAFWQLQRMIRSGLR